MIKKTNLILYIKQIFFLPLIFLFFPLSGQKENSEPLPDTSLINKWLEIGNINNNPDSALFYYHKAYHLADSIHNIIKAALSLKYIGTSYFYKSDYQNASKYWQQSYDSFNSINDSSGMAATMGNLGIIYDYLGDFEQSIEKYTQALSIYEKIGDSTGMARNINYIGIIYEYQGNYTKALEYYLRALTINEEIGNKNNVASNLSNIAIVYKSQNQLNKALEYHQKALAINKEIDNTKGIATNYTNMGIIYTQKKSYKKALEYLNEALTLNELIGNKRITASIQTNIGVVYEYLGNYNSAIDYYKKAKAINKELNDKRSVTICLINLSSVYNKLKYYNKALSEVKEGLRLSQEIGDLDLQRNAYQHLADSYEGLGNYKQALLYKDLWITLNDSIYNQEKTKAIADLQIQYETEKKDQEIESLQKDNEIQELQLNEKDARNKAQRWLFIAIALVLLAIILIIWFIYSNYRKQQTINQQKLNYQKVLTEQKLLRSQMNPHFIYNSLNSIQSFISSNQSYEAEKYLAQFAKLIRGILENSRTDLISLEKEIEVLTLYLNLEQLRFENRFSYSIHVDDEIEQDFISIPPMLVQPFIENAILHGFKNKNKGEINIHFNEKEDFLICIIDDNGIGRGAASLSGSEKKHKSLATSITKERLDALSTEYQKPAFFTIEDKTENDTEKPLGTRVIIQIPIIEN